MSGAARAGATVALITVLLVAGSWLYWWADGSPGTPAEFRERVATAGLEVDWVRNGHSGGDGVVDADCGPIDVTVRDLDGDLFLFVADERHRLDRAAIDDLLACELD